MSNILFRARAGMHILAGLIACATIANAEMLPGTAIAKVVKGTASYIDNLGSTHVLSEGTILKQGYSVQTGAGASVDLMMEQNGRLVGLFDNTVLALDNLTYRPSILGNVFDTRLDLKRGRVFVSVSKLLAGARYEIKTAQGIASVRGTEAYIDGISGQIWVVSGTVSFEWSLLDVLVPPPPGSHTEKQTIIIPAGHSFFVTQEIDMINFRNGTILPLPTGPPSQAVIDRINASALGHHYDNPGNSGITVKGAWFTELNAKQNVVNLVGTPALVIPSP